nr:fat-like cadherin-related tumor suppressor-like protein [Biomphalaria glabrata]
MGLLVNSFVFLCYILFAAEIRAATSFTSFVPDTVTILATTKSLLKLNSMVNCDVTTVGHICTCLVNSNSIPFEMFWLSGDAGYYVYYDGTSSLTPGTTIPVRVDCKDNNNNVIGKQTLNVVVSSNQSPTFTNPATSTVTIDARVTDMYDTISTSTYTDPENDALTFSFSMTSNPSDNYFSVGAGDGIIRADIDMHTATTLTHKLTVSATDSYNTVSPAYVLYVEITNINTAPSIDGLPAKVFLPESAKAGDTIVVLSITDDGNLPLSPVCSATSTADNVKFTYDSNSDALVVKYDGAFDYETQSSYSFTCTVSDGYLSSSGNDVLTLIVTNVNEMPVFNKNQYFCVLDEGSANSNSCKLNAVITDPEDGTVTSVFFLSTNNGYRFSYSSDYVTFAVNYDLDQDALPSDVTLILAAVDSGGLTATVTVNVHVNDVNDNSCQTDALKSYSLNQLSTVMQLGTFSQSDADVTSPNNDIYFEVTSGSPSSASSHIYVARNGDIFYANKFDSSDDGTSFKLYVRCLDNGSPKTTSTTTIVVRYDELTTTTTTTTTPTTTVTTTAAPEKDIWEYDEFKALFGSLMAFLGLLALLGLIFLLCRYCTCPKRQPKLPKPKLVKPQTPPEPRALTPVTQRPAIQSSWDNFAWSNNDKFEGTL